MQANINGFRMSFAVEGPDSAPTVEDPAPFNRHVLDFLDRQPV